mgnify:CR=1 FL=1|jgi:hypothetical protein
MKHNFPKNVDIICKDRLTLKQMKEIFHLVIDNDCPIKPHVYTTPVLLVINLARSF